MNTLTAPQASLPSFDLTNYVGALTAQGMSNVIKGMAVALYAAFVPMFYSFFVCRALGLSALCYNELATQAATTAIVILPFAAYCICMASKSSLRAVFMVSSIVSAILGIVFAAVV